MPDEGTGATTLHVLSRGAVHRRVTYPGEELQFEVSLLCTDDPYAAKPRSEGASTPYDSSRIETLFSAAASRADESGAPAQAPPAPLQRPDPSDPSGASDAGAGGGQAEAVPHVNLKVCCAQVFGQCLADSTWVNDISQYTEQFSRPPQPRQEEDDGQAWGLWSWLGGRSEEPQPDVRWDEGSLPTPVPSRHHSNSQPLLETSAVELLQRDTPLHCGTTRTFALSVRLPQELPPSYFGYAMKYIYHVWCCAVWTQGGRTHKHVLKLPFAVWNPAASLRPIRPGPLPSGFDYAWRCREVSPSYKCERSRSAALPCFERMGDAARDDGTVLIEECQPVMDGLKEGQGGSQHPGQQRQQRFADSHAAIEQLLALPRLHETPIQHEGVTFLRLTTLGMHCCTGGTVSGLLTSIDNDTYACVRVSIKLGYEEQVPETLFKSGTFVPPSQRSFPKSSDSLSAEFTEMMVAQKRTVAEVDEIMLDCEESSFSFILSPANPPTLYTDKIAVEWSLSFEFHFVHHDRQEDYLSTGRITCDNVILWQLPLQVHAFPTEQGVQAKAQGFTYAC